MGSSFMMGKKKMEVNPRHSIVKELKNKFTANEDDRTVKDLIWLIYETAALTSGFTLKDPVIFAGRIHKLIKLGLSIDEDIKDEVSNDQKINKEVSKEEQTAMEEVD